MSRAATMTRKATGSTTTTVTTTTAVTRTVVAALATSIACVVAGAGCSAAEPPDTGAPSALVPAPDPLRGPPISDSSTLAAALLEGDDLPSGFVTIPDPVRDLGLDPAPEYDSPDRSSTDPAPCAAVLAPVSAQLDTPAGAGLSDAVARFSGPNFSSVDEDAASYAGTAAAEVFEGIQQTWAGCSSFSGTDADGVVVDYSVAGRQQSSVGDASASIRLTTESEGFTLVSDVVLAVVDATVVQVVVSDQSGLEPDTVSAVATKAVDRIRAASQAT